MNESNNEDLRKTRQLACIQQSKILDKAKSSTLLYLEDSIDHVIDLGKLAASVHRDDSGEIIQNVGTPNIELSLKCFSEVRSLMKTKLEYLKFGVDLIKNDIISDDTIEIDDYDEEDDNE